MLGFSVKGKAAKIAVLAFILVFMACAAVTAVPVNASVPGLTIYEPEYMYKVDNVSIPTCDGSLSTWKKDSNNLYVLNGKWDAFKLYYGPATDPYQNYVGNSYIDHTGWIGKTWIQGVYKYSDGTLLGFVHREAYWSDSSQDCFYIGLAKSTDNGVHWKYLGDIIKPHVNYKEPVVNGVNSACGNIAGIPYLIVGSNFYLYYNEQTGTEKRMSVARASLADVKTAIDNNTVTAFYKYNSGTWTEAGMGGTGSNIVPGGTISNTGLNYGQGHNLFDLHSDAAYCTGLGKYLMTANDESNGRLLLFSSTNGLNWSEETVLDSSVNGSYSRDAYSSFMSLSSGTSDDCSTIGNDFYIIYPRDYSAKSKDERMYRIHCIVGNGDGVRTANDDSPSINYVSGWFYNRDRNLGDYNNDGHFSQTVNATCNYTFTGTGIDYYSEKYSDMGNVDVYIDNVFMQNVDLYNSGSRLTQQLVYSVGNLPYGSHTIKIVNKNNHYGGIDYFRVYTTTMVNNSDSGITYSGSWQPNADRGFGDYSDDVQFTEANSDYFQYTFTGTGVDYVTEKYKDMGNVDIYIDNVLKGTVDCYNSTRLAQQTVYGIHGLANGTHTIKAVKKDGEYMLLDALIIY